jgi:hypothetical protein
MLRSKMKSLLSGESRARGYSHASVIQNPSLSDQFQFAGLFVEARVTNAASIICRVAGRLVALDRPIDGPPGDRQTWET